MPVAPKMARYVAVFAFWTLFALGVAHADPAPAPPVADPSEHAEVAPPVADPSALAGPAPASGKGSATPADVADSVVVAPAGRDSTARAAGDGVLKGKDAPPAEQTENAAATSEKPPEASKVPAALAKPVGVPDKLIQDPVKFTKVAPNPGAAVKPRPRMGARGMTARGAKGDTKARALARSPVTKHSTGRVLPKTAPHEGFSESERVAAELERTERYVGRAQRSVLLSKNTRAMKLFTSALDFQSDSRDAAKVRQYARAERLTLAARDFADRASRMVGPPREDPDYVDHVLRRTDDAIERAKDVLKTGAGRTAWSRHEQLSQDQKEAWKTFKTGDVGLAYRETLAVREGVLALLRQLEDLPVPRETAEKAIGGAQAALEQANRELGPKPNVEALRLVRLANDYLAKARQSFGRGSYRSALLQAKVVERHVEHAVDVGRPRSG
ncbi:MAG TPA: hypothetical protein VK527_04280 [Candidatus Limnocylindrales bacterium]|nr:hypothetical protein [Candidatus Limnocylindrales bacterium]